MQKLIAAEQVLPRPLVVLEASAVWCILSIVYLSTLAGNHTEAEDGIRYLNDINSGDPSAISSPYHLAYGWFGYLAYHLALALGYGGGPLLPVQVANALLGALGIALLWILLRRVAPGRVAAAAGCGLLAFSYGYWWYSVEVEVYILSVFLLIVALFLAYLAAVHPSWKSFALLGGVNGLAILAHSTNVLFVTVAMTALLFACRELPVRDVARCALAYAGAGVVTTLPPYALAVFVVGLNTPGEVYDWLTGYVQADLGGGLTASTVPQAVAGAGRALVGGHFVFSFAPVPELVSGYLANKQLSEEVYLVRDFSPVLAGFMLVLAFVVVVALLVPVAGWLRRPPRLNDSARVLALLCLGWLVPYALFFTWWEPYNIEFWIAPWAPLAILLALGFSARAYEAQRRFLPYSPVVLVGTLFAVNLLGSVWPQQDPEDDYWRERSSWYERNTTSSDLVVATDYIWSNYLRYFTQADVLVVEEALGESTGKAEAPAELRRRIDASSARRVLFSSEVFYPASNRFSRPPRPILRKNLGPIRDAFLPRTHVLSDEPLEEVRELEGRRRTTE